MKLGLLLLVFAISGCGYSSTHLKENQAADGNTNNGASGNVVDFATVKAQVFQPYCIRCHSAAGGNSTGVNLETFASVSGRTSGIKAAVDSGFMPRNGTLPASAKGLLNAWFQAGSPEFATTTPGPTQIPGTSPSPTPGSGLTPVPNPCDGHGDDHGGHNSKSGDNIHLAQDYYLNKTTQTIFRDDQGGDCDGHSKRGHN